VKALESRITDSLESITGTVRNWRHSRPCRSGRNHIVRRQRTPDPLERKLSDRLDNDGTLHCREHSGTDQNWPGLASSQSREATLDTVPIAA
jgi:hypothetical protein